MTKNATVASNVNMRGPYVDKFVETKLLPDIGSVIGTLRSDESFAFEEPLLKDLINTRPMRRLKRIGFLGAIDYVKKGSGSSAHRRRHNRYEHSLSVAKLAETFAQHRGLDVMERRLIVAAALLHDVGHGPLSHTLEPVFDEEFGVNHHQMGRRIILGTTKLGDEIARTLTAHSIDPKEVISLIDGKHDSPLNFLFGSHVNLDTLEGITRCRAFIGKRNAFGSANSIVARVAGSDKLPTAVLDEFWQLKHSIYNLFINADIGLTLDSIAQAYMRDNIARFSVDDFLATEDELRNKHQYMFYIFGLVAARSKQFRKEISQGWLSAQIPVKKRSFFVDQSQPLVDIQALDRRYQQSRKTYSVRLEQIIS